MEPDKGGLSYPKRDESAFSEDVKITVAIVGVAVVFTVIIVIVFASCLKHRCLTCNDRLSSLLKSKKKANRVSVVDTA